MPIWSAQYWPPHTDDLEGEYDASSLENRMRFLLEVLSAIRKRVGNDFIVGARYTPDEVEKGGITTAEGLEISKHLAQLA